MKTFFSALSTLLISYQSVCLATQSEVNKIHCEGYVTFRRGTLQGPLQVILERNADGAWDLNQLPAGANLSGDPETLVLDASTPGHCEKVSVEYDHTDKAINFQFSYNSPFQEGVCQTAAGHFNNCIEEHDEEFKVTSAPL